MRGFERLRVGVTLIVFLFFAASCGTGSDAEESGEGAEPGQLGRFHNMTTDSKGNINVAEGEPGRRAQTLTFQDLMTPLAP